MQLSAALVDKLRGASRRTTSVGLLCVLVMSCGAILNVDTEQQRPLGPETAGYFRRLGGGSPQQQQQQQEQAFKEAREQLKADIEAAAEAEAQEFRQQQEMQATALVSVSCAWLLYACLYYSLML